MPRTRVFVGASLDGFIAGPNDELDWLSAGQSEGQGEAHKAFAAFLAQIGAVLMGRRTYDIVRRMNGPWPYGDTPMLIATSRRLTAQPGGKKAETRPSVRAARGSIAELIEQAKKAAGDRDVYVDGGQLIRSALDADLIDEITVTIVPMVIGAGIPLFAGVARHHPLELISHEPIGGGAVSLTYRPRRR